MSEQPAPYNSAEPKHVKSRKQKEDRQKDRDEDAWRFVMSTEVGRHFVWLILSEAGMFKQAFCGNSKTDFNCGRADVGLVFHRYLTMNFSDLYAKLWIEHLKIEEQEQKVDVAARVNGAAEEKENNGTAT